MKSYFGFGLAMLAGVGIGAVSAGGLNAQGKAVGMRIHSLYVDAHGESHFRDMELNGSRKTPAAKSPSGSPRPA